MSTKRYAASITWATVCAALFASIAPANSLGPAEPTAQEVLMLLQKDPDTMGPKDIENYNNLLAIGERAVPALVELLRHEKDSRMICRIIGVFSDISGDKTLAIDAVKKVLANYSSRTDRESNTVKAAALDCLARIGRAEDVEVVWYCVSDNDEEVSVLALSAIAQLGRAEDIESLREYAEKRRLNLSQEEIALDRPLNTAYEAIGRLRMKEKTIPTAREIMELLPGGPDMLDSNERRKYAKLIAMGESALPALTELLRDEKLNPDILCRVIGLLTVLPGNKDAALAEVRKTIELYREKTGRDGLDVKMASLSFLEHAGKPDDADMIWMYVDDTEEMVGLKAIRAIGAIGRIKDIDRLKEYAEERKRSLQSEDIEHDLRLNDAYKAIERLTTQERENINPTSGFSSPSSSPLESEGQASDADSAIFHPIEAIDFC